MAGTRMCVLWQPVHYGGTALNGGQCHGLTSCWNWGRSQSELCVHEAPTLAGHAGLSVLPLRQFETDGGEKLLVSVSADCFFLSFKCC